MTYRIELSKKATKSLKKIPSKHQKRLISAIKQLQENPYKGKQLSGELSDVRSLRVWPYRVLYKFYQDKTIILVLDLGHRQGIYE